jgi:hypothetical protein
MRLRFLFACTAALALASQSVQAQVATFEGLGTGGGPPSGYAGKDWTSTIQVEDNGLNSYNYTTPSGNQWAWIWCCGYGNSITNTGGGTFNLLSALVGNMSQNTDTFQVYGLDAGANVIYQQAVTVSPTWHTETFNFMGVTEIRFSNDYTANMTLDDVTFSAAVLATPEPATLSLLSIGLVGVLGAARRRQKQQA